jgi:hypothetical protein
MSTRGSSPSTSWGSSFTVTNMSISPYHNMQSVRCKKVIIQSSCGRPPKYNN